VSSEWVARIRPMLEQYTRSTPGSLIEERSASIAWHHRMADPEYGSIQARDLRSALGQALGNLPVEIVEDDKVIDLHPHGLHRGRVIEQILATSPRPLTIAAFGNDRMDEDMFQALPSSSIAIHVGAGASLASIRLPDYLAAREFLRELLDGEAAEAKNVERRT
jgi:trehalose 6-phosphate synthase/phosphatase